MRDPERGEWLREEAIQRVTEHANSEWKTAALAAVRECARALYDFTTDDVWEVLRRADVETHENRAMGGVMRAATGAGLVAHTDRTRLSERPECHRRPVRIWQSRLIGST